MDLDAFVEFKCLRHWPVVAYYHVIVEMIENFI